MGILCKVGIHKWVYQDRNGKVIEETEANDLMEKTEPNNPDLIRKCSCCNKKQSTYQFVPPGSHAESQVYLIWKKVKLI